MEASSVPGPDSAMADEASGPVRNTPMTDEERAALAAKLDDDLETFMSGLEKRRYTEGWPEDRWQEEMEKHPFFMTKLPAEGEEMSPLMQGLQQLKYDETENTPSELAISYKDDGNFNFKCRKYRCAIIGYTEGLRKKCGDPEIDSQLLNNRAASHFNLNNFRSCIEDCKAALALKPDYPKCRHRLAEAELKLARYDDCMATLDVLLSHRPGDDRAKLMREKAVALKKVRDRDERKKATVSKKKTLEEEKLKAAVRERGITMEDYANEEIPGSFHCPLRLEADRLVWPIMLLYPEIGTSDLVQEFHEDDTFAEHLAVVFESSPPWDVEQKYRPDCLRLYFEGKDGDKLIPVDLDSKLGQVLPNNDLVVKSGTPCFLVVVRGSKAEKRLVDSYK